MHALDVKPVVTERFDDGYTVVLRGTAALASVACGWFKTKIAWWRSDTIAGEDILLDIAKSSREPALGTVFDAALYWTERGPGRGEPIWAGRFRVTDTRRGTILEELEFAGGQV
jgi:hypothetical protein